MLKEIFTQVNLKLIKLMDSVFTHMSMDPGMKENGLMMSKKDKEKKLGSMVPSM